MREAESGTSNLKFYKARGLTFQCALYCKLDKSITSQKSDCLGPLVSSEVLASASGLVPCVVLTTSE